MSYGYYQYGGGEDMVQAIKDMRLSPSLDGGLKVLADIFDKVAADLAAAAPGVKVTGGSVEDYYKIFDQSRTAPIAKSCIFRIIIRKKSKCSIKN